MNSVKELSQNSARLILESCTKMDIREEVAKISGVSHDTISKVEKNFRNSITQRNRENNIWGS